MKKARTSRRQSFEERWAIIEQAVKEAAPNIVPGPSAARSQDFLYDEDGLPNGDGTPEPS